MQQQDQALTFTGLSLSSNGGELPAGSSPVFHNCDISADGAVVRRPGSDLVRTVDTAVPGAAWSHVMKTKRGKEYLVTVTQSRITIQLIGQVSATNKTLFAFVTLVKAQVFTQRPVTDVNFVALSAPYDRLLILTGNYPPIQLSFQERTASFTCTNAAAGTITAPSAANDSPLWRDNTISGTFLNVPSTNAYYTLTSKSAGFTMNAPSLGMVLNEVRELTLTQVSWQWWAEALLWKGRDLMQSTTRYNVSAIDQNVKIPDDLVTDMDPRFGDSGYRDILMSYNNNFTLGLVSFGINQPNGADQWGHGNGQRYNFAVGNNLQHTPNFATFGTTQAAGTQTTIFFQRRRELRFNSNTGIIGNNLAVFHEGVLATHRSTADVTFPVGDYGFVSYFNGLLIEEPLTNIGTRVHFQPALKPFTYTAEVMLINKENKWFGASGREVYAQNLPPGGGALDGTYVPAFGLGQYCDYLRGRFTPYGCLFRDRLVLKTSEESVDQLVFSATADELSPGQFYAFFQITDALQGLADDPFTANITTKSREKLTAMLSWQQSLFVFTAVSTYSLTGGEVFGPDSYTTGLVASYGAFNNRCVVATNLTVLFLNRFGLFDLLNKNNTADYGPFERSAPVRSLFKSISIEEGQERLPWLSLNDTNNKAYMALPVGGDVTACRTMLSLNLSWNSWSTIASSAPFNACIGLQVLNSTFIVHKNRLNGDVQILDMDATHHLDFATNLSNAPLVATHTYLRSINNTTTYPNKVVKLLHDTPPVLSEYTGVPTVIKVATSYITTSTLAQEMVPRNWMFDVPELAPLLGASTDSPLGSDIALYTTASPFTVYPRITGRTTTTVTLDTSRTVNGDTASTISIMGTIYPSVFATTPFNASSLGRLKRLKKLHLLFDNTSVTELQYADYNSIHQNSAVAVITSNYQQQDFIADSQLVGDYVNLDSLLLDVTPSIRERDQLSIPLQGFGCDYQLYLCSTGGDAFKLVSYEFDVQPQRTKTYVSP